MKYRNLLPFLFLLFVFTCKSVEYIVKPEQININQISIFVNAPPKSNQNGNENKQKEEISLISLEYSENKVPFIKLKIGSNDSGIDLIKNIKEGIILDPKIFVKDNNGETIGSQSIDTANVDEAGIIQQVIQIDSKNIPKMGEFIAVYLDILYIHSYLDSACDPVNRQCEYGNQQSISNQSKEPGRWSKEEIVAGRQSIMDKISEINQGQFKPGKDPAGSVIKLNSPTFYGDANVYAYREWNLSSIPRYFKINSILNNEKIMGAQKIESFDLPELPEEEAKVKKEKREIKDNKIEKSENFLQKTNHPKRRQKIIYTP